MCFSSKPNILKAREGVMKHLCRFFTNFWSLGRLHILLCSDYSGFSKRIAAKLGLEEYNLCQKDLKWDGFVILIVGQAVKGTSLH